MSTVASQVLTPVSVPPLPQTSPYLNPITRPPNSQSTLAPIAMNIQFQVPATPMANAENHQTSNSISGTVDGAALRISGEVMVGAVIFLFMVLVFVVLLYLYAKRYWGTTLGADGAPRARLIFVNDTAPRRRGLDETVLQSLPVTTFRSSDFKDGLECSVCLSDISDGEKTRLLPKCNHGFHLECIDMWFFSHSTCPLCRASVVAEPVVVPDGAVSAAADTEAEAPPAEFPTNVLFWGTQDQVSTAAPPPPEEGAPSGAPQRPEGVLVIDIPRRAMDAFSAPVSPFTPSMEEIKSPASDIKSPTSARFRSLRRLLSYGKRAAGPSSSWTSPRAVDIELGQGALVLRPGGSATTPRTPPPPPTHS